MYNQWLPSSKDSTFMIFKKQRQQKTDTKGLTVRHCNFFHVQIHCPCQWIMTLPPKILWPTALLNTWNIITFPKSSFYHTNHTFLTNINVWMMDFWSINTRIKKNSSAQNTILCREWLLQKLTFRHSEITIFNHSQYPTQRTFGEPPAPSVYIYIYIHMFIVGANSPSRTASPNESCRWSQVCSSPMQLIIGDESRKPYKPGDVCYTQTSHIGREFLGSGKPWYTFFLWKC